jgi:hypothetical protein
MPQYLLPIHGNADSAPTSDEWSRFFGVAQQSGTFRGGSEIGKKLRIGNADSPRSSDHIVGFMRFDAEEKQTILDLLQEHSIVLHGGTVELCEMPESE